MKRIDLGQTIGIFANVGVIAGMVFLAAACEGSDPQDELIEQSQEQEVADALVDQIRERLREEALNAIPRMEEMESGEGPIVRARVDTTGIVMISIGSTGDESNGTLSVRARLPDDGSFIFFHVSNGIAVPDGTLVDIRVGEYGYYFDAIVEE